MRYGDTAYAYTANGELASRTQNGQTVAYDYDELGNLRSVDLAEQALRRLGRPEGNDPKAQRHRGCSRIS